MDLEKGETDGAGHGGRTCFRRTLLTYGPLAAVGQPRYVDDLAAATGCNRSTCALVARYADLDVVWLCLQDHPSDLVESAFVAMLRPHIRCAALAGLVRGYCVALPTERTETSFDDFRSIVHCLLRVCAQPGRDKDPRIAALFECLCRNTYWVYRPDARGLTLSVAAEKKIRELQRDMRDALYWNNVKERLLL